MLYLVLLINLISSKNEGEKYVFVFNKIDNKVEIIINDSLVYDSGTLNHNPELKGLYNYDISKHLTRERNEVIVRLYNGFAPYPKHQKDKHWEIEYSLFKNGKEYDLMWDVGDDYRTGLVFEEKYYL